MTDMNALVSSRDLADPGDQVLRRFRYQHAYGVITIIRAIKLGEYVALWCEQHEDFLAERTDGTFDAFQIKTRKPELGEWECNDEAFYKSIKRFVDLDSAHPQSIKKFFFVSDARFSNSASESREAYSPVKLLQAVKDSNEHSTLLAKQKEGFEWLINKLGISADSLFTVLKRTDLVLGPTERAFEDELCQSHISTLEECAGMNAKDLRQTMEGLIAVFAQAASLVSNDASRHWVGLTESDSDPYLLSKRIAKEHISLAIKDMKSGSFHFLKSLATLTLGDASSKLSMLRQKLARGGLGARYEVFRRRSLSAEQNLLDLATRTENGSAICSQIENVVLSQCDDAHLRASQQSAPYGPTMLIDVQDRLQKIAENEPKSVANVPYDVLVGVSGLLTSECKVWWSDVFELKNEE